MSAQGAGTAAPRRTLPYLWIAALAACLAMSGWALRGRVALLHNLEGAVLDAQLRARGPLAPDAAAGVTILMIDERSIEAMGRLPIDRAVLARAVERLKADGAVLVAFDMLFAEPDRQRPETDAAFAAAMGHAGNVYLAFALDTTRPVAGGETAPPAAVLFSAYLRYNRAAAGSPVDFGPARLLAPIPALAGAAQGLGHVSAYPGPDGSLRQDYPALAFDDELLPSLAVAVAARVLGARPADLEVRLGEAIRIGDRYLPLDALSRQWVNYYGPAGTFPTFSLADYLAGRLDPARMRGRIVIIGGSALGNSDLNPSPYDPLLPGVERLATVIDNLLTGRWLQRPPWAAGTELAAMLLLPLLAVAGVARWPPAYAWAVAALPGLGFVAAMQVLLVSGRSFVSVLFPVLALLLGTGLAVVWRARGDARSRLQAEIRLQASEQRYALAAAGANDGLWDWDLAAGTAYLSDRARELVDPLGRALPATVGTAVGGPLAVLLDRLDRAGRDRFLQELQAHFAGQSRQFSQVVRYERGGEQRWLLARGVAVREAGRPVRMAGSLTDVTELKRLEEQIVHDALHDRLTGLANRDLFADRLVQLLSAHGGQPGQEAGVLLVDVDAFRDINERHGQIVGNALLVDLAERLKVWQAEGRLVARLGGDRFALAYAGPYDEALAERVRGRLALPCMSAFGELHFTVSIAHAHSGQGPDSGEELLSAAELALAHGKSRGTGLLHRFDPGLQALEHSRHWLDEQMDRAIAAGDQFGLYYQPFIRLADRRLIGFEALIRWRHPERGLIMPGDFIPQAECSARINAIGRWSQLEVARQLREWDRIGFRGEIAVNLSGRQFSETDLEADALTLLDRLGAIDPRRYKFEVTESMAMDQPERTAAILDRLAGMGFKIAIDDFGTGYSSLAYLYRFPFDTLKIDRSFVMRLGAGREAREIIRTIVGLGVALGKQVLAEGVEREEEARELAELGVHLGQGWLFARALPAEEAGRLIVADLACDGH